MPTYCFALESQFVAPDGPRRMADNALLANMLPIAESKPEDNATMVTLVVNLINQDN